MQDGTSARTRVRDFRVKAICFKVNFKVWVKFKVDLSLSVCHFKVQFKVHRRLESIFFTANSGVCAANVGA